MRKRSKVGGNETEIWIKICICKFALPRDDQTTDRTVCASWAGWERLQRWRMHLRKIRHFRRMPPRGGRPSIRWRGRSARTATTTCAGSRKIFDKLSKMAPNSQHSAQCSSGIMTFLEQAAVNLENFFSEMPTTFEEPSKYANDYFS